MCVFVRVSVECDWVHKLNMKENVIVTLTACLMLCAFQGLFVHNADLLQPVIHCPSAAGYIRRCLLAPLCPNNTLVSC